MHEIRKRPNSNSNVSIPPECQRRYDLPHFNRLFDVAHMDRLPLSLSSIVFLSPFVSFHRCFDRSCMPFVFAAAPSSSVVSPLGGNRRARTRSADGFGSGAPLESERDRRPSYDFGLGSSRTRTGNHSPLFYTAAPLNLKIGGFHFQSRVAGLTRAV